MIMSIDIAEPSLQILMVVLFHDQAFKQCRDFFGTQVGCFATLNIHGSGRIELIGRTIGSKHQKRFCALEKIPEVGKVIEFLFVIQQHNA